MTSIKATKQTPSKNGASSEVKQTAKKNASLLDFPQFKVQKDQITPCVPFTLSKPQLSLQKQLSNSLNCSHTLYRELLTEIDALEWSINEDISENQKVLAQVVKQVMNEDSIRPSEDNSQIKMRSTINLNYNSIINQEYNLSNQSSSILVPECANAMSSSSRNLVKLNSNPQVMSLNQLSYQLKEELKEDILEDLKDKLNVNFVNENKIKPINYLTFNRQDKQDITKYWMKSDQNSVSLDNSTQAQLDFGNTMKLEAKKLLRCNKDVKDFCIYDFKPVNQELLTLQRLDFLSKQQKIRNYLKNQQQERFDEIKINNSVFVKESQQWLTNCSIQRRSQLRGLQLRHPIIYEDFQMDQKHHTDVNHFPSGYYPQFFEAEMQFEISPKNQIDYGDEEEWDELQRYKDNFALIPASRYRFTKQFIAFEPNCHLINNILEYEVEYKRRMMWTQRDIETFLKAILENPPNFWTIHKLMPQKTTKELVFFYQSFKKLFNLKKHYQTCKISANLPSQAVRRQTIQDIISECVKPLLKYQNEKKNSSSNYGINQGVANAFTGQNQIYFTVQELMQIYQANSEPRRKFKEAEKNINQALCNYHFNTFKQPEFPDLKVNIDELPTIPYFDEVERRGNRILDYFKDQVLYLNEQADSSAKARNLTARIAFYLNAHTANSSMPPQSQIKQSLQTKYREESILKKRKLAEYLSRTSDRDIKQLTFVTQAPDDHFSALQSKNFSLHQYSFYERKQSEGTFSSATFFNGSHSFNHEQKKNGQNSSFTDKFIQQINSRNKQKALDQILVRQRISDQSISSRTEGAQVNLALNGSQVQQNPQTTLMTSSAKVIQVNNQLKSQGSFQLNASETKNSLQTGLSQLLNGFDQLQNGQVNNKKQDLSNSGIEQEKENSLKSNQGQKRTQLAPITESGSEDSQDPEDSQGKEGGKIRKGMLQWKEDEKEKFIELLQKHGRDWLAIANELPRKTDKQCRNYFQNYKHKLGLHQYLSNEQKQQK